MITLVWMYSQMSLSTGILLEMLAVRSSGQRRTAIIAAIDANALPSAKRLRIGDLRKAVSRIIARQPPNHAAVVTASNMFELGQRPETYQRRPTAKLCVRNASVKIDRPTYRAGFQRKTIDSSRKIVLKA